MFKYIYLLSIPLILFSEQLSSEQIEHACSTKGFISKFESTNNCINYLSTTQNKKKTFINKIENLKNMSELFNYAQSMDIHYKSYPVIRKEFIKYSASSDLAKSIYSQKPYQSKEYFNIYYKNKKGVLLSRGPESKQELKDYILNFKNEHFNNQLNLNRLVFSLNKNEKELKDLFKIYTSLNFHISNLDFFSNELLIVFFNSIINFNLDEEIKDEFLISQLKLTADPIIRASIFNNISTKQQLTLNFNDIYNDLNKYLNTGDFRKSFIPASSIVDIQTKLFNKILILEVLKVKF